MQLGLARGLYGVDLLRARQSRQTNAINIFEFIIRIIQQILESESIARVLGY